MKNICQEVRSGFRGVLLAVFCAALAARGGRITVKVTGGTDNLAMPGAEVTVLGRSATNILQKGRTDANGICLLSAESSESLWHVDVRKVGLTPLRLDVTAQDVAASEPLVFRMKPTTTIGGVVYDQQGRPMKGVKIAVNFPQRLSGPYIPLDDLGVTTDDAGRWRAVYVPPDVESIHLEIPGPMFLWEGKQPSLADLLEQKAVLTVLHRYAVRGRVVSRDGHPVAGAKVVQGAQRHFPFIPGRQPDTLTTLTDQQGNFEFPPVEAGKMALAAMADGFGPAMTNYEAGPAAPPVKLVLADPHPVRVHVVDLDGHPIAGVSVRIAEWESFRYPPWTFTTDADGWFTFTNAPADRMTMAFAAPGYMDQSSYPAEPTSAEHVVRMGPELRLHGRVTDAQTHEPIAAFLLERGFPGVSLPNNRRRGGGPERPFRNGTYDWTIHQPQLVERNPVTGFAPADFVLWVEADGYESKPSRVFRLMEKDAEFDFALQPIAGFQRSTGQNLPVKLELPEPTASDPVKTGIVVSPTEVRPGESFELMVGLRIAPGYHIYASTNGGSAMTETKLDLKLPAGIVTTGDWLRPTAARANDGARIYTNEIYFRRTLKASPDMPIGKFKISAQLEYQACNKELCFPPNSETVEASVNVAGARKEQP